MLYHAARRGFNSLNDQRFCYHPHSIFLKYICFVDSESENSRCKKFEMASDMINKGKLRYRRSWIQKKTVKGQAVIRIRTGRKQAFYIAWPADS
jgi:hypothetical protein